MRRLWSAKHDIDDVIARWTGIPVSSLQEEETAKLLRIEEELHQRIISQESAISALARAIRRSRAGLRVRNRPVGSFLFLGPTGVGKTEVARSLAEFLFGAERAMIRFDMSEFMEKHSVSKLIGSPPGYVGHEEGGQLTERIRRNPYSVLLLDEIEKAHPDIFNILLQVFEDGVLTDALGNTVDFKNVIVIMTSNIGAEFMKGCTRSTKRYPRRTITIRAREDFHALQAARQRETTPAFATAYTRRAGIEGTLSRGLRICHLRQTRYVGAAKTHLGHVLFAAGLNLLRLGEWFSDCPRAKTRRSPFATLMTDLL